MFVEVGKTTLRVVFIFLNVCALGIYSTHPTHSRWKEYGSLCPYNNLCTTNATKHQTRDEQHLMPCCQQCSCDPDCHKYGVCCPDTPNQSQAEVEFPCVNLDVAFNDPRGMKAMGRYDVIFHVIDRCPNLTMADKYKACQTQSSLRDYVVVTDITNGRVYKNSHCADCNGVQQYTEWDILTECDAIYEVGFETFDERDAYIVANCSIIPIPPDSQKASIFRCFPEHFSITERCATLSGGKPMIDGDTKAACETDMLGVNTEFYSDKGLNTFINTKHLFKNIFCYLCTRQHRFPKGNFLCDKRPYTFDDAKVKRVNLMMLISYASPKGSEAKAAQCNISSIWDQYSESCLKLSCPGARIPYNGKCISGLHQSTGVAFTVVFNMETEHPMDMSRSILTLDHGVTTAFDDSMSCGRCGAAISQSKNMSQLYFSYYLYTQENCTRDMLLEGVARVFKNPIIITVPDMFYPTVVTLTALAHQPTDQETLAFDRNQPFCPFTRPITPLILQNCARIDTNTIPFKHEIEWTPAIAMKMIDGTLCVRDYFMHMESLRKHQGISSRGVRLNCYLWLGLCFLKQALSVLITG